MSFRHKVQTNKNMKHEYGLKFQNVELKPLQYEDIELLRTWRNDSKNSRYLRKIPYITHEQEKRWFLSYLENQDELIFGIYETKNLNRLVGSVSLYNFQDGECELGKILIGDSLAHGHHIGLLAVRATLNIAFRQLLMKRVYLHVYRDNIAALRIYQQIGFSVFAAHIREKMVEYSMEISRERFDDLRENEKQNISQVKMLEFAQHGDERGHLVVIEGNQNIPFDIKRVFYIYGSDSAVVRGKHANRKTKFVLINVAGKSKVKVKDGEGNEAIFCLNRSHTGIYLPEMVWKEMFDFSENSVLLVLASEHYDPNEYIRDYYQFQLEMRKNK